MQKPNLGFINESEDSLRYILSGCQAVSRGGSNQRGQRSEVRGGDTGHWTLRLSLVLVGAERAERAFREREGRW
jgi:hypothetical protein